MPSFGGNRFSQIAKHGFDFFAALFRISEYLRSGKAQNSNAFPYKIPVPGLVSFGLFFRFFMEIMTVTFNNEFTDKSFTPASEQKIYSVRRN